MQRSRTRQSAIILDETFDKIGTFYRLVGNLEEGIRSLHFVGDGTIVCSSITVQHCDMPANLDGTSFDPNATAASPGWGLGPAVAGGNGAEVTVGVNDPRLWLTDPAIAAMTIAASATATGAARVCYGNQAARFTRVVIVVSTGGRLRIAGAGGLLG